MTAKQYKESQQRAGELQKLMKDNPEEAKRQIVKNWEPFAKKVREYRRSLTK